MLRLERSSPFHQEVAVRFRSREPFLTRPLLIGLAVALLLHLAFFLTVQFHTYSAEKSWLHPPIAVEIDLGPSDSAALASSLQIDKHGLLPRYLIAPESSRPELPSLQSEPLSWHSTAEKAHFSLGDAFAQAEQLPYELYSKRLFLPTRYEPIRIALSGPLADRHLVETGLSDLAEPRVRYREAETYSCQFDVNLEERNGQVFWIALLSSCGYEPLDQRAEQIVRQLRIEGARGEWTTPGVIEVLFEVEAGDPLNLLEEVSGE